MGLLSQVLSKNQNGEIGIVRDYIFKESFYVLLVHNNCTYLCDMSSCLLLFQLI